MDNFKSQNNKITRHKYPRIPRRIQYQLISHFPEINKNQFCLLKSKSSRKSKIIKAMSFKMKNRKAYIKDSLQNNQLKVTELMLVKA